MNNVPNGAETAKRRCKGISDYDAKSHETGNDASRDQTQATSSPDASVATGPNGLPQGKTLDNRLIASRITSPTNHLTSRISHRHEDRNNDEKNHS
ncbi:hypothetical protein KEM48_002275 [Puccinia striiformis f. sp. tritici PST-130]|nr:hypothetical protein H4Q26_001655 [Puccinia striiformis f. sp. tritici PST-130]KAI9605335.1 hypothetical protein KEM48_002275 [Puccinia striiformis f. sp. tritici PST-130]